MALHIDEDRAKFSPTTKGSGKGNDVAAIPSPKNRAGGFLHTRLKPFIPPVLLGAVSLWIYPGYEFVGGRLDATRLGFLPGSILPLIAKGYGDCASQ